MKLHALAADFLPISDNAHRLTRDMEPDLDARTHSLLVLAITASPDQWEEFIVHIRAGLSQLDSTRGRYALSFRCIG